MKAQANQLTAFRRLPKWQTRGWGGPPGGIGRQYLRRREFVCRNSFCTLSLCDSLSGRHEACIEAAKSRVSETRMAASAVQGLSFSG